MYKRIVLKLSGEALAGERGFGLDAEKVAGLVDEIVEVHALGVEIGIVVGGGNFFRGVEEQAKEMDRVSADSMGMLSTVINAIALQDSIERRGVQCRVMSAVYMNQLAEPYIRRRQLVHVDGAHHPALDKDAVKYDEITYMEILRLGLKVMDLTAVSLCKDNDLRIIIFNMNQPGNIKRVVLGEKVGSLVTA